MAVNKDFIIVAESLNHNARAQNNRAQLAAVNEALEILFKQQQLLLAKFYLRDID
ncbi:hypothetical protein [Shewanella sp. yb_14]|uniref:hypothetical protein n=1 Tax=unclassified Shewanella TaxID=196818 RepID=UPI00370A8264